MTKIYGIVKKKNLQWGCIFYYLPAKDARVTSRMLAGSTEGRWVMATLPKYRVSSPRIERCGYPPRVSGRRAGQPLGGGQRGEWEWKASWIVVWMLGFRSRGRNGDKHWSGEASSLDDSCAVRVYSVWKGNIGYLVFPLQPALALTCEGQTRHEHTRLGEKYLPARQRNRKTGWAAITCRKFNYSPRRPGNLPARHFLIATLFDFPLAFPSALLGAHPPMM